MARGHDPHLLPVIGKFSAAIQAYDISAGLTGCAGATLSAFTAHGEAEAFVPAAKERV